MLFIVKLNFLFDEIKVFLNFTPAPTIRMVAGGRPLLGIVYFAIKAKALNYSEVEVNVKILPLYH